MLTKQSTGNLIRNSGYNAEWFWTSALNGWLLPWHLPGWQYFLPGIAAVLQKGPNRETMPGRVCRAQDRCVHNYGAIQIFHLHLMICQIRQDKHQTSGYDPRLFVFQPFFCPTKRKEEIHRRLHFLIPFETKNPQRNRSMILCAFP